MAAKLTKGARIALGVTVATATIGAYYLYAKSNQSVRHVGGVSTTSIGGNGRTPCQIYHDAASSPAFPADALARLKAECIASGGAP